MSKIVIEESKLREIIDNATVQGATKAITNCYNSVTNKAIVDYALSQAKAFSQVEDKPKELEEAVEEIESMIQREREYQNGDHFTMFNETFIRDMTKILNLIKGS